MLDILLSQIGLKPDQMKKMAETVVQGVESIDARIKRIEEKLGIEDEKNDGQT